MTTRRSTGKMHVARALWYAKSGVVELRTAPCAHPSPTRPALLRFFRRQSRDGTPHPERTGSAKRMAADAGALAGGRVFPVKYGYCATGIVEDGPKALLGRTVFCLHPHQDMFIAPVDMLVPVPEGVPARRATLAANMETALNAHWDAGTGPGDRIVVVGARSSVCSSLLSQSVWPARR